MGKELHHNLEIPTLSSWSWNNISGEWVRSGYRYHKLIKHVLNLFNTNPKTCAGDANDLMQNYLAINYVHVKIVTGLKLCFIF